MFDAGATAAWTRTDLARAPAGGACHDVAIDPGHVLGALTAAAIAGDAFDAYLVACAVAQFRADAVLISANTRLPVDGCKELHAAAADAADAADVAARALVAGGHAPVPDPMLIDPEPVRASAVASAAAIDKLLAPPLPECCGYNLADPEVCIADAAWLAARAGPRVLVAGIRSGGGMLAPLWAAALAARGVEATWTTLRPVGDAIARLGYDAGELARARDALLTASTDLLLVDDLPDTGGTVALLAPLLVPHAARAWFAAVGRVERLDAAGRRTAVRSTAPLLPRRAPRLWQLLLPSDWPAFSDRLTHHLAIALPQGARLGIRMPALEARYGRRTPWLPWNDPALADEPRRLINPRKTPLTIEAADGTPLWHLRFIGNGPWGRAEHRRLTGDEAGIGLVDGYRVSLHVPGLASLSDRLDAADAADRLRLLVRAADRLAVIIDGAIAATGPLPRGNVAAVLRDRLERLDRRFDLPDLPRSPAGLAARAPVAAGGRILRTSLRYSHGNWHWQVDRAGTVFRFQRETTWGGASTAALEVASFAMEHALAPDELELVADRCGVPVLAAVDHLPDALLVMVDALCRGVRQVDDAGRERLRGDVTERVRWIERIAASA